MRASTLFLLLASLLPAQEPERDVLAMIATAERRLARQAPDEETTLLLWQLEQQVSAMPRTVARDAALATVQALLGKADPAAAERTKVLADAAKKIIEVAQLYRQRKWYDLAEDRVRMAGRFDEAAAQKEQLAMAAARAKEPGYKPLPKPEPVQAVQGALIPRLQMPNKGGDWTIEGEELVAPKDSKKDKSFWCTSTTKHADAELSVEILITDNRGLASLMFGGVSVKNHFVATLERHTANQWALRCDSCGESGQLRNRQSNGRLPPTEDGWHRLVVRVSDQTADLSIDGGALNLKADLERTAHGTVGFIIYGLDEKTPIRFRNLVIAPLPEKADDRADREKVQTELRAGLLAVVERGEKLLVEKKTEAGVLTLLQAWQDARRMAAGPPRDDLDASIEKMLVKADPLHGKRKKAAQEVGAWFAGLVARYQGASLLGCALECAREAAAFDAAANAALVQKCEEAIAARDAAQAPARAKELAPPAVDNIFLVNAFRRSRLLHANSPAWVIDASGARVQQLGSGAHSVLLALDLTPLGGSFAVHVHLPQPGATGGFAFDAHGNNDYAMAVLHRDADKLTLAMRRYVRGKWQALGRMTVPVPAWRLAGWFELRIEDLPDRVKVGLGDLELVVERSKLGKIGPVGFMGEAAGAGPVDVEMRGLRKLEPAAK